MNEFSDLEAELKQLQPRATSPALEGRIEQALAQPETSTPTAGILPRPGKFRLSWLAMGLGTAAAAALLLFAQVKTERLFEPSRTVATNTATPTVAAPSQTLAGFVPDGLTRVVYNRRDEGLVFPRTAQQPVRRVRSRAREILQWTEAATGASLRVSYPTDEVELIPISGQ